jgi:hypothetical protein
VVEGLADTLDLFELVFGMVNCAVLVEKVSKDGEYMGGRDDGHDCARRHLIYPRPDHLIRS